MPAPGRARLGLLGALLAAAALLSATAAEKNKYYHMQQLCKNHFLQQLYRKIDGAVLQSQNERNLDCVITFQTHSILQRFMLRFDLLQLDCNDHLFIYDGAHAVGGYKSDLTCRNTETTVGAIYTRTNFVTLKYVTDGWGTESNGFRLVITAFKDKKHACEDFRCTREFCIDRDLVCDDVNHCGDASDEASHAVCPQSGPGTVLGLSPTMLVVAVVSALLVLCAVAVVLAVCVCRRGRSRRGPLPSTPQPQPNTATSFPCKDRGHLTLNATPPLNGFPGSANSVKDGYVHTMLSHTDESATDVRVERGRCERSYRQAASAAGAAAAAAGAGKLPSPCGPPARVQRGPGPPLLPGRVRSSGSDSDISSSQKDEWFV